MSQEAEDACSEYPFMRLVKLSSDALPTHKTVAIVDGRHGGVSIGRDRTFTARLRLPSMEVSKHHANVFSNARAPIRYSIADTGSTHGTYVCRHAQATFERLSPPHHASRPYTLEHLDLIRIGVQCSVFEVHLHANAWDVCDKCTLTGDGSNEIDLAPSAKTKAARQEAAHDIGAKDGKKRLKMLKHMYVPRAVAQPSSTYRDRAALRRQLHPEEPRPAAAPTPTTAPNLWDKDRVGFRILQGMAAESDAPLARTAPIVPRVVQGRAGLGSTSFIDAESYAKRAK